MSRVFSAREAKLRADEAADYREQHERKRTVTDAGVVIDTCRVLDTGLFETAVKRKVWVAVEEYDSEQEAMLGHEEWVKQLTYRPDMPLSSIH